ncbi:MAG: hypothetical protein K2W96_04640 [Gemmataceae bacterium]|nr:hypothetical protein [Gemmataceae bacterium]
MRHERRDIDAATVFWSGIGFAILAASSVGFSVWLCVQLMRSPPPARDPGLPRAAVDANERPPAPRLEAIEDLDAQTDALRERKRRKPEERDEPLRGELLPPRAAWDFKRQRKENPIPQPSAESLKLKARKEPAPLHFSTRLPSKASAGRTTTGGGS